MRVLVTRPEPDAERTAAQLRARGCEVVVAPLLLMEPLVVDPGDGPWDAIALTSANAVRAMGQQPLLRTLLAERAYAVGRRTAEVAREAGFANVATADGDVASLVDLIRRHHSAGTRVLYLAGEDRAGDLAGALATFGVQVTTSVVYRANAISALPETIRAPLVSHRIEGVLHFSRRMAAIYLDRAAAAGVLDDALMPAHFCLSQQVAEPLLSAGAAKVRVAERPREADLLGLVTIQNPGSQSVTIC